MSTKLRLGKRSISLPGSPALRIAIGILLVVGGVIGFLPILGFWMVPLGLLVLSVDVPAVRRFRRRMEVKYVPVWRRFRARMKAKWRRWRGRDEVREDRREAGEA